MHTQDSRPEKENYPVDPTPHDTVQTLNRYCTNNNKGSRHTARELVSYRPCVGLA